MKQLCKDFNEAKQRADAHIAELWRAAEPAIIFGKEAIMETGVTENTIVSGGRVIEISKKRNTAVAHEIPVVATNKDQEAAESILKGFLEQVMNRVSSK